MARPVLLVGVTGGLGAPVLQGLVEGGLQAGEAAVLTRRTDSPTALALAQQGFTLVQGDLDDAASVAAALQGVRAVYVHALSKDAGGGAWRGGAFFAPCRQRSSNSWAPELPRAAARATRREGERESEGTKLVPPPALGPSPCCRQPRRTLRRWRAPGG